MKTAKIQLVLSLIIINTTLITAQNYHLIYETDIYAVSLKQAAEGKSESKYSIEKGHQHILSFKDKKAINFQIDSIKTNYDFYKTYLVIDKKKTRFQYVMANYNEKVKKVNINGYDKKTWRKNDPLSEPVLGKEHSYINEIYKSKSDSISAWKALEIKYNTQTQTINNYLCKNATVLKGKWTYNVWYTEEINFNWCFNDYRFLIPGTVVLIEKDDKIIFELLSIKPLDYDNLPVRKEIIESLVKL